MATAPNNHDSLAPADGATNTAQQNYPSHNPYLLYSPAHPPRTQNPCQYAVNILDNWTQRAEGIGRNIWHNLRTGPSVSGMAWGKVNLATKAMTEGGFESLFRQNFQTEPSEKLKKTFACYLSTMTTGPISGTLYLTTARVAFCSDCPLSMAGQQGWNYYKASIPLGNIENVNPVVMTQNPPEKYIHVVTVDGHEFWFVGFVNFEKASHHLLDSVSSFRGASIQIG